MSGLTIDFEKRDGWFNFHFSTTSALTADFCVQNPYCRSKEEWTALLNAIVNGTHYPLKFEGENFTYIETTGDGYVTFSTCEHKGLDVAISVDLYEDENVILDILNHILENHF